MQLDLISLQDIPKKVRIDVNADELKFFKEKREEAVQLPKYTENRIDKEGDEITFQWKKILHERQTVQNQPQEIYNEKKLKLHVCSVLAPYYAHDYLLPGTTTHDMVINFVFAFVF